MLNVKERAVRQLLGVFLVICLVVWPLPLSWQLEHRCDGWHSSHSLQHEDEGYILGAAENGYLSQVFIELSHPTPSGSPTSRFLRETTSPAHLHFRAPGRAAQQVKVLCCGTASNCAVGVLQPLGQTWRARGPRASLATTKQKTALSCVQIKGPCHVLNQIHTTMRDHLTPAAGTAKIKTTSNNKCWQRCGKKRNSCAL